ncbi:protein FAM3C [Nelusetta ayraudi]|uniref:protein FAM3C n=1 Tax=Nelusetta ayraudi TaxID=303726 RepID=UPI003F72D6FA
MRPSFTILLINGNYPKLTERSPPPHPALADMKNPEIACLLVVTAVLLITWGISINSFDVRGKAGNVLGISDFEQIIRESQTEAPEPKCGLSRVCPLHHYALRLRSGAAGVVGPEICFEGKVIMSHLLNNVGPGLNIVVINDENGAVEKFGFLNTKGGNPEDTLSYLKGIKPGRIVLMASFDDVTPKLTGETVDLLAAMGSALIGSVKARDSWVFAGRAGTQRRSQFEKRAANDEETNVYEGWPALVEVGGCFPLALS